jgi:hypothetical protein
VLKTNEIPGPTWGVASTTIAKFAGTGDASKVKDNVLAEASASRPVSDSAGIETGEGAVEDADSPTMFKFVDRLT